MGKYYSLDRIKKVNAQYKILLGGRNIGKSYATKYDVIETCYKTGKEFIYLRRWDEDIKTKNAINYFGDVDVKKITDNKYNSIYIYQNNIYFSLEDEKGKITDKFLIGRTHSLNQAERYKSQIFPNVDYILYEEFITDKAYLPNEPEQLQEYVSTIFRTRTGVVYMIGNTISKLCPYFSEWKLSKVLKMKTHDICVFQNTTAVLTEHGQEEIEVIIAVEMCGASTVLSKMAFGLSADMIVKNKWRSKTVALLTKDVLKECEPTYTVYMYADNLCFKLELMNYKNNIFWFVKPQTRTIKNEESERVITNNPSMSPLHTKRLRGINEREQRAFNLINQGKIYYCSTACGTEFEQALKKYGVMSGI